MIRYDTDRKLGVGGLWVEEDNDVAGVAVVEGVDLDLEGGAGDAEGLHDQGLGDVESVALLDNGDRLGEGDLALHHLGWELELVSQGGLHRVGHRHVLLDGDLAAAGVHDALGERKRYGRSGLGSGVVLLLVRGEVLRHGLRALVREQQPDQPVVEAGELVELVLVLLLRRLAKRLLQHLLLAENELRARPVLPDVLEHRRADVVEPQHVCVSELVEALSDLIEYSHLVLLPLSVGLRQRHQLGSL